MKYDLRKILRKVFLWRRLHFWFPLGVLMAGTPIVYLLYYHSGQQIINEHKETEFHLNQVLADRILYRFATIAESLVRLGNTSNDLSRTDIEIYNKHIINQFKTQNLDWISIVSKNKPLRIPYLEDLETIRFLNQFITSNHIYDSRDSLVTKAVFLPPSPALNAKIIIARNINSEFYLLGVVDVAVMANELIHSSNGLGRLIILSNNSQNNIMTFFDSEPKISSQNMPAQYLNVEFGTSSFYIGTSNLDPISVESKLSQNRLMFLFIEALLLMSVALFFILARSKIITESLNAQLQIALNKKENDLVQVSNKQAQSEVMIEKLGTEIANLYRSISECAIISVTDKQGRIEYANEAFLRISKYELHELIGQNHRLLRSSIHPKEFYEKMWQIISNGKTWQGEIQNLAKDGQLYWERTTIAPIFDSKGQIEKYLSIRFDITQEIQDKEISQQKEALMVSASKMALLGQMAGNLAHEINSPLSAIVLICDGLTSDTLENIDIHQRILKVKSLAMRIANIVRAVKNFSHISNSKQKQWHPVNDILQEISTLFDDRARRKNVRLSLISDLPPDYKINCFPQQLTQVVANLVQNSLDAIENLTEKWIDVAVAESNENLAITVVDSGQGIPGTIRDKVFKSYFTTKEIGKGTGLGLSLCRQFIEHHGGSIFYDSNHQHTCFKILLPKGISENLLAS